MMDDQVRRVRDVFDDWGRRGRGDSMETNHGPSARRAFDRLTLRADSWYLDVGCGNGYSVRWAASACPQGRAYGIDTAPAMIERARQLSLGHANAEFLCTTFPEQSLPSKRFDAIFSMEALYYLPDLDAGLARVAELLRGDGHFVCTVDYYLENNASHSWPDDLDVNMTLLSEGGWRSTFEKAGLEVTEQMRLKLPPEQASEPWKCQQGSLMTLGRKPA